MSRVTTVLLAAAIGLLSVGPATAQIDKPRVTPSPTDRLPAPARVIATQERPGGPIRVVWSLVGGARRYSLTRSVPPTPAGPVTLPNSPDTVYLDEDVQPGSTYYYLVGAVNEAGITGLRASAPPVKAVPLPPRDTAKAETAGPSAPALAAPTNVVASPYPYMKPTVTWQSSEARARFLVERRGGAPSAPWEQVIEGNRLPGLWKCCVAHDPSPLQDQHSLYRVTAVDTVAPKLKSPPALSNAIVNWTIKMDPPVLHDTTFTIGQSGRIFTPNVPLRGIKWVSLEPQIVTVDLELGIVNVLRDGSTYIVASGSTSAGGLQSHIWRVRVDP